MNINNLKASEIVIREMKQIFRTKKKTVLFGYFDYELEKKTRLQRHEAQIATEMKTREIEKFMIRKGKLVLLGADKQSYTDKDFRIIDKRLCMVYNGRILKKSHIARAILKKIVGNKKIDWHSDELSAGAFDYAPFFFKKGNYENAVMIDLRRAHYSIYSRLSFDLRLLFNKNKFIGFCNGEIKFDSVKPNTNKVILQRIYGAFASKSFSIWDGLESESRITFDETKGYKNELYSPTLVFGLMQTLHHIAAFAVKCGAVYVYTDGYMFKKGKELKFIDFLDELNLGYKVEKFGNAVVFGYNCYDIGGKRVGAVNNYLSKRQIEDSKERKRSDAFREIINEVFGDYIGYENTNIDFSAVNFLNGKDMRGKNFNLAKK